MNRILKVFLVLSLFVLGAFALQNEPIDVTVNKTTCGLFEQEEFNNLRDFIDSMIQNRFTGGSLEKSTEKYFGNFDSTIVYLNQDLGEKENLQHLNQIITNLRDRSVFEQIWVQRERVDYFSNDKSVEFNLKVDGEYLKCMASVYENDELMNLYYRSIIESSGLDSGNINFFQQIDFRENPKIVTIAFIHHLTVLSIGGYPVGAKIFESKQ